MQQEPHLNVRQIMRLVRRRPELKGNQAEADFDRFVNAPHRCGIDCSKVLLQTGAVNNRLGVPSS